MANKLPDYFYTSVQATVLIGGKEYPLSNFKITYTINEIPVATFGIALGRSVTNGPDKVSTAHGMFDSIKPFTPVEIKTKLTAKDGRFFSNSGDSIAKRDSGLKNGQFQTVFKGFLFTPTQEKTAGRSATLTFQALGYFAAMGGSTEVTTGLISTKLESGADVIAIQLGTSLSAKTAYHNLGALIRTRSDKRNVDDFLLTDLFPSILQMINSYESVGAGGSGGAGGVAGARAVNTSARAELERLRNYPLGSSVLSLDYGTTPKELYDKALARQYNDALNKRWFDSGADLWTILKEFSYLFAFKIVPAIEHDALIAVTYGLNGEPWRAFEPSDYWQIHLTPDAFTKEFYSYVGSVGLNAPNTYHSLFQDKLPKGVAIGFARLPNLGVGSLTADVAGRMVTEDTPTFMLCPGPASKESGLGGRPAPDAANPNTAIQSGNHGEDMRVWYGRDMGNSYAQVILHDKVFEHRTCTITGRFRLDIAPGSLVRIRTIGDRFVGKDEILYGHAIRVTLSCDSGSDLSTEVLIGSIRTKTEHELYTVPVHPLYKKRWVGAMLTD